MFIERQEMEKWIMLKKCLLFVGLVFLPNSLVHGQVSLSPEAPKEMKQLEFLVGGWKGSGTLSQGPTLTSEVEVSERVQYKLNGSVLMIEGRGISKQSDGMEKVVHDALALISFDKQKNAFVMQSYRAGGEMLTPEIEVAPGKIVWSFVQPQSKGRIRFTLTVDDDGNWQELGEFSPSGQNEWYPFFNMKLKKEA